MLAKHAWLAGIQCGGRPAQDWQLLADVTRVSARASLGLEEADKPTLG